MIFIVTCRCPRKIYTNYHINPPYTRLVGSRGNTTFTGIFPEFLKMIVDAVCTGCRSYSRSVIVYNQTLTGHPSMKVRARDVKLSIKGSQLSFPLFGKFDVEMFQGQHPYVGIVESQGSAMIVPLVKVKTVGFMAILKSITNAWSVMLIAVLIASLVGWMFWFFVSINFFLFFFIVLDAFLDNKRIESINFAGFTRHYKDFQFRKYGVLIVLTRIAT